METVKETKREKNTQLAMPIKNGKTDVVYGLKRKIDKRITYAGIIPYWRSFFFVAALMSSITNALIISYVLYRYYTVLPADIPLFYNQASQNWQNLGKSTLIALPIILIVFAIITSIYSAKIFHFDRRLVLMLNISIIIANILLAIGLAQILSFILIY